MKENKKGPSASSGPGNRRKEIKPVKPLYLLLLITILTALSIWKVWELYRPTEPPQPENGQFIVIQKEEVTTQTDSTKEENNFWPSMPSSNQTRTISPWSILKTYTPSFNL